MSRRNRARKCKNRHPQARAKNHFPAMRHPKAHQNPRVKRLSIEKYNSKLFENHKNYKIILFFVNHVD
jgi:hypothetical protein